MAETLRIDARGIREGIKKGLCVDDFCEKYGVDNEEFFRQLRRLYPHNYMDMEKRIRKAGKRRAKSRGPVNVERTMSFLIKTKPEKAEEKLEIAEEKPETAEEKLARLKKEAEEQQKVVIDLETKRKQLGTRHKELINELRGIRDDIKRIKQKFEERSDRYEKVVEQNNQVIEEINSLSEKRQDEARKLDELRTEIENLHIITLGIYASGEIKIEEGLEFELDDTSFETLFSELISDPVCEDLRVRDIRTLARLVAIERNATWGIELVFEDEEVEKIYRAISDTEKEVN